jgi:hypothetical protein
MTTQSQFGNARVFYVIHPLDDEPEEKRNVESLGPMRLTPSVKYSLFALRTYLILMMALAAFRVLSLAGVFGHLLR